MLASYPLAVLLDLADGMLDLADEEVEFKGIQWGQTP